MGARKPRTVDVDTPEMARLGRVIHQKRRVEAHSIQMHAPVQMWSGSTAALAHGSDDLARRNRLTLLYRNGAHVGVDGG